ncbi:hypothetical protein GCM10010448_20900 [Streptomyces glomeratus]|uniref:Uncharacterized protein n=1 Tax=Streptomyces glomeratus TaxID=284452 RepID=A0ABP6LEJ3_9ACTN
MSDEFTDREVRAPWYSGAKALPYMGSFRSGVGRALGAGPTGADCRAAADTARTGPALRAHAPCRRGMTARHAYSDMYKHVVYTPCIHGAYRDPDTYPELLR